jgi:N-carbamoyl-L-amino-acid hydrolase
VNPSQGINQDRLWSRLMALAQFGARADGGVDRQALTNPEIIARAQLVRWGRDIGLVPFTDSAANLFLRLEGQKPDLPPVLAGSHIDSQPTGGKFDGSYGVLAALEAVEAIRSTGRVPNRAIEVVAWMNEEGSRFSPGMTGSELFTGVKSLGDVEDIRDGTGVKLGEALRYVLSADSGIEHRSFRRDIAAFIEPHIEQGPVLDRAGIAVGVVTGIQGTRRYRVRVHGEAAHAGTTERHERKDALLSAVRMISAMDRAALDPTDLKFTVGLFNVTPNAPSVVPAEVLFSVDVRHPANETVDRMDEQIRLAAEREKGPCSVSLQQIQHSASLTFPERIRALISRVASELEIAPLEIYSAAGHDARQLHYVCPTGMIFVPCKDGISHNPAEWAEPADLWTGARVLTDVIWRLADEA